MKKILLFCFLSVILFSACENDDNNPSSNTLKLSKESVIITDEEAVIIDIENSQSNNYSVTISNSPVVYTAIVLPGTNKLYIWGNAVGEGTVTVGDGNSSATVKVEINSLIPRGADLIYTIRMKKGDSYKVTDFAPETILFATNKTPDIVAVDEADDGVIFNALEAGETKISFYDSKLRSNNYSVIVVDKFELSLKKHTEISKGEKESILITGNGDYEIEIANPSIVSATIRPYTEEEKSENEWYVPYGAMLDIEAIESGETTIKIKDSENLETEIKVIIN